MKYIDAEKLKRFVGELKELAKRNCCDSWGIVPDALEEVEGFIASLQQEQTESSNGKFVFPNYLYARTVDNKTIDVSYAPQSLDAVEYIKNDPTEQTEVDLEKFISDFIDKKDSENQGKWCEEDIIEAMKSSFDLGLNARKEENK